MSNLTVNFNIKTIDKIIIQDDSDDTFLSKNSTDNNKMNQNCSKSLFNKYGVSTNKILIKNKQNTKTNDKKYVSKRQNGGIVNETKDIMEKSYIDFQKSLVSYYNDVLEWMNMIYNDKSTSILKVQIKRITLNDDIFNKYNEIIKKYKLKKDIFDTDNFNIEDNYDYDSIAEIAKIMTKNLVEKLNYKLDVINDGKSKKLKIKNISKEI